MVIGNVLQCSTILKWDVWMSEEKKEVMVPDDITIIWVNIL